MVHYEISYPEFSANRLWIFSNVLLFDDLNIPIDVSGSIKYAIGDFGLNIEDIGKYSNVPYVY